MIAMPRFLSRFTAKGRAQREKAEFTRAEVQKIVGRIHAKYDAAQTTSENSNHWGNADALSVNFANSPQVRRTLRMRGRYERDNNSYCKGIVLTLANDLIGTGPRLQLLTDDQDANRQVEKEFALWAEEIDLANKLRTMHMARIVDGEGFGLFVNNPGLTGPVTLDIKLVEAEQVTSYATLNYDPLQVDGIRFDKHGNPKTYFVLPYHPGGALQFFSIADPDLIPASQVLHWMRSERPGQARGIPDMTPSLPLFAQLRRYTLATLMAAEIAAELTMFMESNLPAGSDVAAKDQFELIEMVRGMMTTIPSGWKVNWTHPEQPTNSYGEFVDKLLREILNCLEMPFGLGVGDFSGSNYSSGRLDVQRYQRKVKNERASLNRLLNRIFLAWLEEAMYVPKLLPKKLPPYRLLARAWQWDGFDYVDPVKEAQAVDIGLKNYSVTLADVYASRGQDYTEALPKIAAANDLMKQLGLSLPGLMPAKPSAENGANVDPAEVPDVAAA
jgi:lambda family phage portal protein